MLTLRTLSWVLIPVFFSQISSAQVFKVTYSSSEFKGPFSGRVIIYLSKETNNPKDGIAGLPRIACFAVDVKNISPGKEVQIDDNAISFPVKLSDIERGEYYVQAVWDRNSGGRSIGNSPGNLFSASKKVTLTKNWKTEYAIQCNNIIEAPEFPESKFTKELSVPSGLLESFYKRPTKISGAVVLPKEYYDSPNKKFPVLIEVSGYGGSYFSDYLFLTNQEDSSSLIIDSTSFIYVFLDGNCPGGHSVYANSENNGPWGDALVNEFLPALDKKYRTNGARLLWGHSSGGWSVLWLQTQYPGKFLGCWSSSPDPVDFRRFGTANLYEGGNMFYNNDSSLKADATIAGFIPTIYSKEFYRIENVLYRGEQMKSFENVFSKKAGNGMPEPICNVNTGSINTTTADNWKKYDLSLLLRENWSKYKALADDKIRISVGTRDNYFLNQAVSLFEKEMKNLNAKIEFKYYPGDHFTIATRDYYYDGFRFLLKLYKDSMTE